MSFEFYLRLIGMFVLSIGGMVLGARMAASVGDEPQIWALTLALTGALFGLILTPHFTTRPTRMVRDYLNRLPARQLVFGVVGLIVGLIIAALVSLPLSLLPTPYNAITPVITAGVMGYLGATVLSARSREIADMLQGQRFPALMEQADGGLTASRKVLLDTSVIIDGRIADISQTGFVMGSMIVPRFILNELQYIADSPDTVRRQRGRRGIEILNELQKHSIVPVEISDIDVEGVESVDERLILLAKKMGTAIITNDYNLNRIAELQGVVVLNINALANAVKPAVIPGEDMEVDIIQKGRELGQGIGYLDDGTMIVVENGVSYMNQRVHVTVTRVLQTNAGRMIFARPIAVVG